MKKIDYLDTLRGIAIIAVIMVHSQYGTFDVPSFFAKIVRHGAMGVQLFYLVSACTLFLSFKNRARGERSPIRNFFLRRFFRIAPMYYLGIVYYLFQNGLGPRYWLGNEANISVLNILSNFTFLHGFNPYWINSLVPGGWSIAVEMVFYAIFPFLFSKLKNLNQAFVFFILSLLLKLGFYLLFKKIHLINDDRLWGEYLFLYFPNQLPIFCLGILFYFIILENQNLNTISSKSILVFSLFLLAQLTTGINLFFANHLVFGFAFLILGWALSKNQFLFIVNPIINYIGRISFSMYLVHFAILYWLADLKLIDYFENGTLNYLTRFFIVLIITVLISSVLYKFVEIPSQALGKIIINKLEKKDAKTKV